MTTYDYLAVLVVAVVTVFTRALPFLIFGKQEKLPESITYLGEYLPGSIMILLVIYCLRNDILNLPYSPGLYVGIFIFFFQYLRKNTFLTMFVGTALYVLVTNI
ncbi:MAG: AzlD domain-containing protein [Tissierellia bacterium]|nr:AzlD domain-containing protein [Tissierellia bacterium]